MSICRGIGGGIGGAIGKGAGLGLGSALGLGAVVESVTRAVTGYGLLEMLNVPYIECPDGSFATAIEWYGNAFKCPQKPQSTKLIPASESPHKTGEKYADQIEKLGGAVYPYFGSYGFISIEDSLKGKKGKAVPGHFKKADYQGTKYSGIPVYDNLGNSFKTGYVDSGSGYADAYMFNAHKVYGGGSDSKNYLFRNGGWGGWGGSAAPAGLDYKSIRYLKGQGTLGYTTRGAALLGVRASLPPSLPFAPPAADIPPPPAFALNPPSRPEECMSNCPCITLDAIEKAVRKALGLGPFTPEKLIREIGATMYSAPGPSVVPVIPKNLVEAIAALVAANYMRAGYGRYPVVMPDSLIAGDNPVGDAVPTKTLENFAEWFEWHILQQDSIQGQWPIKIAIKDGLKKEPMKFENFSEAIAEMTGLIVQTAADADTAVNAACTAAGIAQKAVNAATIGQKNIECLIQCFGFRTGFKALFVQSSITPADPDDKNFNVRKFLSPSSQNLAVLTDNDPFDFQATLGRILRNSEIARASVAKSVDKDGLPGDFARNQRQYDAAEARRDTEKAMEKLENSIKEQNPAMEFKIKVDGPPTNFVVGDNFVIKRPE